MLSLKQGHKEGKRKFTSKEPQSFHVKMKHVDNDVNDYTDKRSLLLCEQSQNKQKFY